ncbi:hypothetical protein Leryth_022014 [Lithospermum erythrorhizon]|nr:hypothetical protein Leryth_022014 [Lithospermum erythrorhizon]
MIWSSNNGRAIAIKKFDLRFFCSVINSFKTYEYAAMGSLHDVLLGIVQMFVFLASNFLIYTKY